MTPVAVPAALPWKHVAHETVTGITTVRSRIQRAVPETFDTRPKPTDRPDASLVVLSVIYTPVPVYFPARPQLLLAHELHISVAILEERRTTRCVARPPWLVAHVVALSGRAWALIGFRGEGLQVGDGDSWRSAGDRRVHTYTRTALATFSLLIARGRDVDTRIRTL